MTKKTALEPALLALIRKGKTIRDAAKALGIGESTARRWLRDREDALRGQPVDIAGPLVTLKAVPDQEQRRWIHTGPRIEASPSADLVLGMQYFGREGHTWESWDAWAEVYGRLRSEWLTDHERLFGSFVPAAEKLWAVWAAGGNPEAEQARIIAKRDEDPRRYLESLSARERIRLA